MGIIKMASRILLNLPFFTVINQAAAIPRKKVIKVAVKAVFAEIHSGVRSKSNIITSVS